MEYLGCVAYLQLRWRKMLHSRVYCTRFESYYLTIWK